MPEVNHARFTSPVESPLRAPKNGPTSLVEGDSGEPGGSCWRGAQALQNLKHKSLYNELCKNQLPTFLTHLACRLERT